MNSLVFVNRFFAPDCSATSQLLSDLAFALARHGADVKVVTSRQLYDNPSISLDAEETTHGVHVTRVATSRFGRDGLVGRAVDYATFYLNATRILLNRLKPGDLVIAKTDPPLLSLCAGYAAKQRGATLVNWIQDLFPEVATALDLHPIPLAAPILLWLRNRTLQQAACNVVLGERMKERLIQARIEPNRITVIPNWADGQQIRPIRPEENPLRAEWKLGNRFVVGYSGNLGRAHEFNTILGAAEKLKTAENIVFLFIGGGAQRDWIEQEAKRKGLTNILFKPYQLRQRLGLSLNVPDVHLISLQPALEGLIVPSKFYGIAAAGRPTLFVGDPEGEIPRILRETACGYTIPTGDSECLANLILKLSLGGDALNMGARARIVFDEQFDQEHAFAAWEHLLQQVSGST